MLLLKAIYRFYLDQLDQNLWQGLLRLWSMYEKRKFQDYHVQWLCAKYMVVLAVHMGDREAAERIKQDLAITFDEPLLHRRNYSSSYQWSPLAFYTMAQIDKPDFEAVIQENKGKFSTIDEYKEYFNAHMMYLYR